MEKNSNGKNPTVNEKTLVEWMKEDFFEEWGKGLESYEEIGPIVRDLDKVHTFNQMMGLLQKEENAKGACMMVIEAVKALGGNWEDLENWIFEIPEKGWGG